MESKFYQRKTRDVTNYDFICIKRISEETSKTKKTEQSLHTQPSFDTLKNYFFYGYYKVDEY